MVFEQSLHVAGDHKLVPSVVLVTAPGPIPFGVEPEHYGRHLRTGPLHAVLQNRGGQADHHVHGAVDGRAVERGLDFRPILLAESGPNMDGIHIVQTFDHFKVSQLHFSTLVPHVDAHLMAGFRISSHFIGVGEDNDSRALVQVLVRQLQPGEEGVVSRLVGLGSDPGPTQASGSEEPEAAARLEQRTLLRVVYDDVHVQRDRQHNKARASNEDSQQMHHELGPPNLDRGTRLRRCTHNHKHRSVRAR
mmetsp:Transcript_8638/g.30888  ORF Transcript_8638/g.30888 Transcript_8638/m.30888 type:complete len:248 (+) Transcript_8638:150-893(+)